MRSSHLTSTESYFLSFRKECMNHLELFCIENLSLLHLLKHSIIYLYQHGLMDTYLKVLMRYYFIYFVAQIILFELFELVPASSDTFPSKCFTFFECLLSSSTTKCSDSPCIFPVPTPRISHFPQGALAPFTGERYWKPDLSTECTHDLCYFLTVDFTFFSLLLIIIYMFPPLKKMLFLLLYSILDFCPISILICTFSTVNQSNPYQILNTMEYHIQKAILLVENFDEKNAALLCC